MMKNLTALFRTLQGIKKVKVCKEHFLGKPLHHLLEVLAWLESLVQQLQARKAVYRLHLAQLDVRLLTHRQAERAQDRENRENRHNDYLVASERLNSVRFGGSQSVRLRPVQLDHRLSELQAERAQDREERHNNLLIALERSNSVGSWLVRLEHRPPDKLQAESAQDQEERRKAGKEVQLVCKVKVSQVVKVARGDRLVPVLLGRPDWLD